MRMLEILREGRRRNENARKGARRIAEGLAGHLIETYTIDRSDNGFPLMRADLAAELEREMLRLAGLSDAAH